MSLGDVYTGIFGGNSDFQMGPVQVDPNKYEYGGQQGGAQAASDAYGAQAQSAQGRTGPQIDTSQSNGMRGSQADALGMQRQAALGNAPSAAAIQQQQGLDSALMAQGSMAASARGPAALAGAQYQAAGNTAAMQQRGVQQASQLRAGEMADARNAYAGQSNAMRGQDMQGAQAQAGLDAGQRGLNDQMTLGMTGYQQGVNNAQLQAQQNQVAQQSQNDLGAQALNQKTQQANAQAAQQGGSSILGIASSALGFLSDERLKSNIQSEGNASAFDAGGYNPSQIGTPSSPLPADPKNPFLGVMSMNMPALGYSQNAPAPPKPGDAVGLAKKPSIADTILARMAASPAGDDSKGGPDAFKSGQTFGNSLFGGAKKLFGGDDPKDPDGSNAAPYAVTKPWPPDGGGAPTGGAPDVASVAGGSMGGGPDLAADGRGLSDARAKREVHDEGYAKGLAAAGREMQGSQAIATRSSAPAQMLDRLEPVSYNYKPGTGEDPSRRRFGVMAQDLQLSPMGASIVEETPHGKMIDTNKGLGVALGASAHLNQRVKSLEMQLEKPDMRGRIADLLARRAG